jgi:hypothetical protein
MSRNCSSLTRASARAAQEDSARLYRRERELVHVEVFLQRRDHLLAVACHLGWIEDHDVEALVFGIAVVDGDVAQPGEQVGLDETHLDLVQARVLLGDLQDVLIEIDADDLAGATERLGVDAEAAGVAAQVEHARAGAEVGERLRLSRWSRKNPVLCLLPARRGISRRARG